MLWTWSADSGPSAQGGQVRYTSRRHGDTPLTMHRCSALPGAPLDLWRSRSGRGAEHGRADDEVRARV